MSRCIKELERIYGIEHGGNHGNQYSMPNPKVSDLPTQEDLANMIGISVDTLNNYKKLTELVPELQDENSKLRALISNNFGKRKNDPAKDRKALEIYVSLRGYKQGGTGSNQYMQTCQNGTSAKSTLDEIAKELNISKRNLTDSMKEVIVYYVLNYMVCKGFLR